MLALLRGPQMLIWLRRLISWPLHLLGFAVIVVGTMLALPLSHPSPLRSIQETAAAVDRSEMPPLSRFQARDGTELAYRLYQGDGTRIVVLVHGSSGSSSSVHGLAYALSRAGITVYAPDIRGHGHSGGRGDISYIGQLEDDLADLVAMIRQEHQNAPIALIGHSAGGGFVLRVAARKEGALFDRFLLLAPYLGPAAPTNRPHSGGWATPDVPRILALMVLRRLGIDIGEELPVLSFAVPKDFASNLTPAYSYRLFANFAADRNYRSDFERAAAPVAIIAGEQDELMVAQSYREAVAAISPKVPVTLIPGLNHMAVVGHPAASAAVVESLHDDRETE
jgi:alpha-beta hydrolase superfamily lysophospholipase